MDANVTPCYFSNLPADLACEATALAPEEQVKVEREKFVNGTLPEGAPRTLIVCAECADRGWDEILGYADEIHDGHPPTWPGYVDNRHS